MKRIAVAVAVFGAIAASFVGGRYYSSGAPSAQEIAATFSTVSLAKLNRAAHPGDTQIEVGPVVGPKFTGDDTNGHQRICISVADDTWQCSWVSSVSGATIYLTSPLRAAAPSGALVRATVGDVIVTPDIFYQIKETP